MGETIDTRSDWRFRLSSTSLLWCLALCHQSLAFVGDQSPKTLTQRRRQLPYLLSPHRNLEFNSADPRSTQEMCHT